MYGGFYNTNSKMLKSKISYTLQHTQETFKALVDAIIPRSPRLAEEYGKIQYFGALDLHTDEFIILSLNSYFIPLAEPTAEMLDIAAEQLYGFQEGVTFAALSPRDRFLALTLLKQTNLESVLSASGGLNRNTMMGYYSEWSGYGSTRLEAPEQRILEYYPLSWDQVGYPGPSLGYRALRAL